MFDIFKACPLCHKPMRTLWYCNYEPGSSSYGLKGWYCTTCKSDIHETIEHRLERVPPQECKPRKWDSSLVS